MSLFQTAQLWEIGFSAMGNRLFSYGKSAVLIRTSVPCAKDMGLYGQIFDMEPFFSMLELNIASFSLINALFNS